MAPGSCSPSRASSPARGLLARVVVQSAITECNDLWTTTPTGSSTWPIRAASVAADDTERDPGMLPQCADGIDNDGNGQIDWPDDAGCLAAGDPEETPPGVPLGPTAGFGHHGSCNTWNACNNAQTCANAACRFYGHGDALEFQEGLCQDIARMVPGFRCNLFAALPNNLDDDWANGCNIPVAYDILCSP
ncbi:MAG: hypothetical protein R3F43_30925 [bacterium]